MSAVSLAIHVALPTLTRMRLYGILIRITSVRYYNKRKVC